MHEDTWATASSCSSDSGRNLVDLICFDLYGQDDSIVLLLKLFFFCGVILCWFMLVDVG